MKLTEWARVNGVHPKTAYRWYREGTLPVPARRVGSRTILVDAQQPDRGEVPRVGLYARVSSHDQRGDLDRQVARLVRWAASQKLAVVTVQAEVASGMNGNRPKLRKMLSDPQITMIVVEHRDRLGRMNTELVEAALGAVGRSIRVVEEGEVDDDLVRDVTEVLTSFCARLYGRRSAKRRAERALRAVEGSGDAED